MASMNEIAQCQVLVSRLGCKVVLVHLCSENAIEFERVGCTSRNKGRGSEGHMDDRGCRPDFRIKVSVNRLESEVVLVR